MKPKTTNQILIEKFCKIEAINWPREMKNIIALLKKEPVEFWQFLVLGFKLNSLAWFNSAEGKKEVEKNKKLFLALQPKEKVVVKNDHEYVRSTEKKKTFKDKLLE